jgi:hypothetical protein
MARFISLTVWFTLLASVAHGQTTSTLCRFDRGPRAGQTQDYAPMAPLPIGSGCQDGVGSTGWVVAPEGKGSTPEGPSKSTLCRFDRGPRAGQTQDYAPMAPLPIGSGCQDGSGSTGWVVAPEGKGSAPEGPSKSTLCRFDRGPRAGQTQDYAPMAPLPIGSGCQDGTGSTGCVVAPKGKDSGVEGPIKSTFCRFDRGPRVGQTQDYAPLAPLPIGSGCQDGAGSSGCIVATEGLSKSTFCRFDRGPRAGQTQDYAPMAPLPIGSGCQDGAGSAGWVVAPEP